ncbi:MAG: CHC2 zinc finger domain-containing protein [Candidatus Sulfotelmatobacter sp.]
MPYVPPELKERLKREVSIQRLVEARGIQLRSSGKELIGLCPFHKQSGRRLFSPNFGTANAAEGALAAFSSGVIEPAKWTLWWIPVAAWSFLK